MSTFLLIWTILSVLIETGVPSLTDIKVIWKRVLCGSLLAPAYLIIAAKNLLIRQRNWFSRINDWLKA